MRPRILAGFNSDGVVGTGHLRNISPRGVFIRSEVLPPPGAGLQVFLDDGAGSHVTVRGVVRWNTGQLPAQARKKEPGGSGFGLLVLEQSSEFEKFYKKLLLEA